MVWEGDWEVDVSNKAKTGLMQEIGLEKTKRPFPLLHLTDQIPLKIVKSPLTIKLIQVRTMEDQEDECI